MKSKFDGSFCRACKGTIAIGEEITKFRKGYEGKWVHVSCTPKSDNGSFSRAVATSYKAKAALANRNVPQAIEESDTPEKEFIPSPYQQVIFQELEVGTGNIVVKATAGSGKTTTIFEALDYVPKEWSVVLLAFGKEIAKELYRRIRRKGLTNVTSSTIHSAGFSIIRKDPDFKDVKEDKVGEIMSQWYPAGKEIPQELRSANRRKRFMLRKIVSMMKATLTDWHDKPAILEMIEHFNLNPEGESNQYVDELITLVPTILEACVADVAYVDYDDMPWLPLVHPRLRNHIDKYNLVLVDETQDLNQCQIQFVLNMVAHGGRVVAVGDEFQSMFTFRGADPLAMQNVITALEAKVLPLSVSYRCPRSHVALAKEVNPEIEAAPDAIEGIVADMPYRQFLENIVPGDMIICRNNAPLVKPAYAAIRAGKKAVIVGKNIGEALINFVERFEAKNLAELETLMAEYTQKECDRLLAYDKELQAETVLDNYATIVQVAQQCKNVDDLLSKLETLFSETRTGCMFSSIHKAKGLQAERVFILRQDLLPHPKAKQEWEKEQELHIKFVALTRSLRELYFVEDEIK